MGSEAQTLSWTVIHQEEHAVSPYNEVVENPSVSNPAVVIADVLPRIQEPSPPKTKLDACAS